MKRFAAAAVAAGLLTSGSAATAVATATAAPSGVKTPHRTTDYTPPPIEWGVCEMQAMVDAGAQCGLLTVPLDYAQPAGTKIKIGVSRIKHKTSDADAQGIMLINPGGPGGAGLNLALVGGYMPQSAGDPYDWIGFDPRGVGTSQPRLACDATYTAATRPDYVPNTPEIESQWRAKAAGYAKACATAGGELLNHLKTNDTIKDIESIRKAFGADKINFYGFSYGSYLGQVYATKHPDRVRRMVWDGVVNWKDTWYEANVNQNLGFDRNIHTFWEWVAKNDSTYHLGTDLAAVKATWMRLLASSRQAPLGGKVGPAEWVDLFQRATYSVYGWREVASLFAAAAKDDYAPALASYARMNPGTPGSDNMYAMYLATQCTDVQWPTEWTTWQRDNWAVHDKAPFQAWANAWYNVPCMTWGGRADAQAPTVDGAAAPPILMISETFDAATPFAGAIQARETFPKSILIEGVGGSTHSGSLSGVECTDHRIADYLLTGKLDPRKSQRYVSDVQCDPVPQPAPVPTPAVGQRSHQSPVIDRLPSELRSALTSAQRR